MAVCKMEMLVVGRDVGLDGVCVRGDAGVSCAKPQMQQRVIVRNASSQKSWPSVALSAHRVTVQPTCAKLRLRCSAISAGGDNADPPHKDYNISEVLEKVTHEEENELPADQKNPEPLPEDGSSPFTPADENTDGPFADEEGGENPKDSLIMPSKAASPSPKTASSSIGEGLGTSEQSTLAADPVGGSTSGKRDWRVHASNDGLEAIFENEGGNSVDDYKLRAHIFEESAAFFTALKNQESSSIV